MEENISAFQALKFRDVRLFLFGMMISFIGSQMQTVALSWHLYNLTNSPVSLGILGICGFLPFPLFGLFGGVIADSIQRKKLLLITQTFLTILSFLLFLLTMLHVIQPLFIYILVFLGAVVSSIDMPVRSAVAPSLVPAAYIKAIVSLFTLCRQIAMVIGPLIVGFLLAYFGPQSAYLLNSISFVVLFCLILFIKIPHIQLEKQARMDKKSLFEGLHFIFSTKLILSTMLLDFFVSFFGSATVLLPVFAKTILQVSVQQLGILYAAPAVGSFLAGFIMSTIKKIPHPGTLLLGGMVVFGLATISFGWSHYFLLSLVFLAFVGGSDTVSTIIRNILRQSLTPDHLRGRMGSIAMIFFTGGPYLGDAEAGIAAGFIGAPWAVITGGIAAVLTTLWVWKRYPQLARYKEEYTNNV